MNDFYEERDLCNTVFENMTIQKYTRSGVGRDGVEVNSRIDFVLVKILKN